MAQLKAGLQRQELGNTRTSSTPTVRATSLLSLLRNCNHTSQNFEDLSRAFLGSDVHPGLYTLCMTYESALMCFRLDEFFFSPNR